MSLPRRLWRLAHQTVQSTTSRVFDALETERVRSAAERELEEFLGATPRSQPPPEPPPPPHPFAREYAVLNVTAGADLDTVERAWRRLVLQHHPDRYAADPHAERAANDRLREINEAHEALVAWLRRDDGSRSRV